jgi:hypothetical protein
MPSRFTKKNVRRMNYRIMQLAGHVARIEKQGMRSGLRQVNILVIPFRQTERWKINMKPYIKQTNSLALVRERTTSTERPPIVGEVSANVCG